MKSLEKTSAELSERQREQALERFAKIRPCVEEGVSQAEVARAHGVSSSTVQRWIKRYREQGLAGLAREGRADRGHSRGLSKEEIELIEGLYLRRPRPQLTSVYRKVCRVAREQGWKEPSYDQVYRIVRRLSPALETLAHEGAKAYREQFEVLVRFEASRANELWQVDHCRLHIWLVNERGRACKPYLTIVLDDYSRCITGYRLSWGGLSAAQTALALRGAIWSKGDERWPICGIPESLYSDHGSDFTSNHVQALAVDLKIELLYSQQGRPRGRGKIERFFRTVEQELLVDLPGYAPKVDWRLQAESDRQSRPGACLTLEEFDAIFRTWLLERYHTQVQEGIGEAPMRRWEAGGVVPVMPPSLEHLDVLLLTFSTRRRVQQDGIAFQGQRYFDVALAEYVGEDVVVRYDPSNREEIAVYVPELPLANALEDVRERFVCRARCWEVGREGRVVGEVVEVRARRREVLRRELREHRASVERYVSTEGERARWKAVAHQAVARGEDKAGKVVVEEVREEPFEQEEEEPQWKRYEHE